MITKFIKLIIKSLTNDEIVAIPTDTIYSLSCRVNNIAINRLINLKKRKTNKGFIIISHKIEHLLKYINISSLSYEEILKLKKSSIEKPITWIAPAIINMKWFTGNKLTIAIRLVKTPYIQEICSYLDDAIISTSANISGKTFINNDNIINDTFKNIIVLKNENITQAIPSEIFDIKTGQKVR